MLAITHFLSVSPCMSIKFSLSINWCESLLQINFKESKQVHIFLEPILLCMAFIFKDNMTAQKLAGHKFLFF